MVDEIRVASKTSLGGTEAAPSMRSIYTKAVFDGFNNKTFVRPKLKLVYGKWDLGGSAPGPGMRSVYTKAVFDDFNNKTFWVQNWN